LVICNISSRNCFILASKRGSIKTRITLNELTKASTRLLLKALELTEKNDNRKSAYRLYITEKAKNLEMPTDTLEILYADVAAKITAEASVETKK